MAEADDGAIVTESEYMPVVRALNRLPDGVKGMVLMLIGVGIITINDALMKLMNESLPLGQTLFLRSVFVGMMVLIFAYRSGGWHTLRVYDWRRQLTRGAILAASSWCFFYGLLKLPLAEVIAIASVGPLFLTMFAGPFLGETIGWRRWIAVGVGFVGAMVIIQPGGESFVWAAVFPLATAFLGAFRDIVQRQMSLSRESTVAILGVSTACVALSGLVTLPWQWVTPNLAQFALIVLAGMLMGTAHYLMIEALRLAEAGSIAPLRYTNFLWGSLWGFLIWGVLPVETTWIGVAIIAASGLYILHRETIRHRQESRNRHASE